MIEAIVLAAGESRRMGQLKPLLKIGDKTVLAQIVGELKNSEVQRIKIVVGYQADRIRKESGMQENFVVNDHFQRGQFSSLQKGVSALSTECTGVIVCLADQPQIKAAWIDKISKSRDATIRIVRPTFKGQSGHPVLYAKELFEEIIAMPATSTAKELMKKYARATKFIEISSDAILYDADTPEDFEFIQRYL